MKSTVTERGQVSIPAELRRAMRLTAGQSVWWEKISDRECRIMVEPTEKVQPDPVGAIGFAERHGLRPSRTADWMGILRKGD